MGATIYYSTNGTTPTTSSNACSSSCSVTVATTETLEAIATATGYSQSAVATAAYTITGAGGGALTGSGTANYVPMFTGSSTLGNSVITQSGNNVGIGTTSPLSALDVNGVIALPAGQGITGNLYYGGGWKYRGATGLGSAITLGNSSDPAIAFYTAPASGGAGAAASLTNALSIYSTGNIGIGTYPPAYKLDVTGDINTSGQFRVNGTPLAAVAMSGNYSDLVGAPVWQNWGGNVYLPGIAFIAGRLDLGTTTDNGFTLNVAGNGYISGGLGIVNTYNTMPIPSSNVAPVYSARLSDTASSASLLVGTLPYSSVWMQGAQDDLPGGAVRIWKSIALQPSGGNVGIGTTNPQASLEIDGNLRFTADGSVQTTAWTGVLCGGDYAEAVNVAGAKKSYEPGDVLVLSSDKEGNVQKSSEPYSTLAAGIYATKPGVIGRRESLVKDGDDIPMAMVGIVPTKVSAENGAIRQGDLLVTSSTLGYAMKGTDRSRLVGAVIGKAMGSLDSGTGVIEVLVTLQ